MDKRPVLRSSAPPPARAYEPNALLRWVYRRFFSHMHVDEAWTGRVREAARSGVVVYVMRSISLLDFLCLDFLLKRYGLPLVRFVNDLGWWILEPFGKGDRRLRLKRQIPEEKALGSVVAEQFSALLFLRKAPRLGRTDRKGEKLETDLIRTLVETQRNVDEAILLVPQTFVWSLRPPAHRRSLVDIFFGPVEWPGKLRVFFQFLFNYRNATLRAGEPFDLATFIADHQDLTDGEIADKVRYALLRRMERERTLVLGPTNKTVGRIQEELLRSPRVRKHIESESRASKRSIARVERYARKELQNLAARQTPYMVAFLGRVLDWVWNRIYDGIVVDEDGIERVRAAMRDGAVVLLPSHKSHVDYLVLSQVLYARALAPPLIAAGDNLSFWPLGPILRRGGAFFIRRSFRGKKLYAALVDAYIRKLLVEGFPIEFFIEGGRSRTGKLMPPKYGLLSMVIDAALKLRARKVFFVPISIGYERIVEERSYVHELSGGEKQRENVGGLLRTPRVLRSKYGRLYVQFGEILSFDELRGEAFRAGLTEDEPSPEKLSPKARRGLIQRLAHRVAHEINDVTVVTPAALIATAFLGHRRRGMTYGELLRTAEQVLVALEHRDARVAGQIRAEDGTLRQDTVNEAIALFLDSRLIQEHETSGDEPIYRIPEERRIALEYYKNNILHYFVPSALISAALHISQGEPVSVEVLRERVLNLSKVFKYEFMFRADATFDEIFDDALAAMLGARELERTADHVRVADGEGGLRVPLYRTMMLTYFESYLLALRGVERLVEGSTSRKDWLKRTLALGQRMYLSGELELRESFSKTKLETALKSLKDLKLVKLGDQLAAGPELKSKDDLRDLEQQLAELMR